MEARLAPKISVVVNTLNAERWLDYALRSVRTWTDEIVVVDMHSTDRTREIAEAHGARVLLHEPVGYVEPARKFAIDQSTGDWILVLDADELVPEPLSRQLRAIAASGTADAVSIPRLNYILGAPILHTGWGPDQDRHIRFLRRGCVQLPSRIHGAIQATPSSRLHRLPAQPGGALVHFNLGNMSDVASRIDRYTTIEAAESRGRGETAQEGRVLVRGIAEFFNRYVRLGGWRDGWRGLHLSTWMAMYRVVTDAKLRELELALSPDAIVTDYRRVADEALLGYERAVESAVRVTASPETPTA
jgi:glycosyltransferase involved in cell wall biosynthesis